MELDNFDFFVRRKRQHDRGLSFATFHGDQAAHGCRLEPLDMLPVSRVTKPLEAALAGVAIDNEFERSGDNDSPFSRPEIFTCPI